MSQQGRIYILINPAMKDLLKIGRTKRFSEDRANELSKPTGVPTEFIVAYEELFDDVVKAEQMIHSGLNEYRYNQLREFFKLPLKSAIRTIIGVKGNERAAMVGLANSDGVATCYNNTNFRSALHARWAVFFDMLYGLEYMYIDQPVTLPSGALYQPDFWLPALQITCKIGESEADFSVSDLAKTIEFSYQRPVLLVLGYPGYESLYMLSERRNIKDQDIDDSSSAEEVQAYFDYLREWGHWVQFGFDVYTREPILVFRALIPNDDAQLDAAYEAAGKVKFSCELNDRAVDDQYFFDNIHERRR